MLSREILCLIRGSYLLAGIAGVPFVHDIAKGRELVIALCRVHGVIEGNQPDAVLSERLCVNADLQIISAESAHILDTDYANITGLNLVHHCHKAGAVKAQTGDTVIGEVDDVGEPAFLCEGFENLFLVGDRVRFKLLVIVRTGTLIVVTEPLIERRDFLFLFSHMIAPFSA